MRPTGPAHDLPSPRIETALLVYLLDALRPMPRTRVKQLLRAGRVWVNGASTTRHDHPLRPGDRIAISREGSPDQRPGRPTRDVPLIHLDDVVAVIDKPTGLLSVATETEKLDTAFTRLKARLDGAGRPYVVHRLDRETSGLLLFARSAEVRDRLQAGWDHVSKTYLAIVAGRPAAEQGVVENYLVETRDLRVRAVAASHPDARLARSRYRVLAARDGYSLVEVGLETGRKHQIRVHLAGLGCPVIGDPVYGNGTNPAGRLGLHAWRLAFDHPATGQRMELEAPFPEKLRRVVGLSRMV